MKRGWCLIIVLGVCFVFLVVVLFCMESVKVNVGNGEFGESGLVNDEGESDVNLDGGGGSGSNGVDGVDGVDGVGGEVEGDGFVLDISGSECGFYFEGYGVCNGTCPDGVCVSEGRSCYCKIV